MLKKGILIVGVGFFVLGLIQAVGAQTKGPQLRDPKTVKLIILGGIGGTGGQPTPLELQSTGAKKVDALPIDGLVYNISHSGKYFADSCMTPQWQVSYGMVEPDVTMKKTFGFQNVKEHFVRINVSAALTSDWYDNAAWEKILNNIRVGSRAAKEGTAVGFMLDTEQYNGQPFNYTVQARRAEKNFDQYREQVRKRGRQFMEALGSSLPAPKILFLYANSQATFSYSNDAARRTQILQDAAFGLLPAFIDGMMDGDSKAEFIDGFEGAYNFRSFEQFLKVKEQMQNEAPLYSADPQRYQRRMKVGYGICLHTKDWSSNLDETDFTKNSHTPEEFKHALYYAMALSDGYVWLYSVPWFKLPKEYYQAVVDARMPQDIGFKPLERPEENKPAAYIISTKGRTDCADEVVFAPYRNAGYQELYDFPKKWKFRLDPQDTGVKKKWYKEYEAKDWMDIEIGDWWEPQLKATYLGYAWYRFEMDVPDAWKGKKLYLAFGAVDEEAWIWLNGEKAGEHALGPGGWNSAFEIDVSGKLIPGRKNTLVVRVYNSAGVGGIFKSVKLYTK